MKIRNFFREGAALWFVGLLTVQFCAGLVFALDAERVRGGGREIKILADSIHAGYSDDSAISVSYGPIELPHSPGASAKIDAFARDKNIPYRERPAIDVEFRRGGDGLWRAAAYGKNADPSKGEVFELSASGIVSEKYDKKLKKMAKQNPVLVSFTFGRFNYRTLTFDSSKFRKYIAEARKKNASISLSLRQGGGLLAISGLYIGGRPVEEIIEEENLR